MENICVAVFFSVSENFLGMLKLLEILNWLKGASADTGTGKC